MTDPAVDGERPGGTAPGTPGRIVLPGRQRIGLLWRIGVGVLAAFVGTGLAAALGVADTKGIDWIEWFIQIALTATGVAALERIKARR